MESLQEMVLCGHGTQESISIDIQDFCMETILQDMLRRGRLLPADTGWTLTCFRRNEENLTSQQTICL